MTSSPVLLQVTASSSKETSKKGLYAIAALLRNNADARALFYDNQGVQRLIQLLKAPGQPEQVMLKVLNLVTDLSQLDLSEKVTDGMSAWRQCCLMCDKCQLSCACSQGILLDSVSEYLG